MNILNEHFSQKVKKIKYLFKNNKNYFNNIVIKAMDVGYPRTIFRINVVIEKCTSPTLFINITCIDNRMRIILVILFYNRFLINLHIYFLA